jgi:hypothetical protein
MGAVSCPKRVRELERPTKPSKRDSTWLKTPPVLDEAVVVVGGTAAVVVAGWATTAGVAEVATAAGAEVDVCCPAAQAEDQSIPIPSQLRADQLTVLLTKRQ